MNLSGASWLFVIVGGLGCVALAWIDSTRHFRRHQHDDQRETRPGPQA